MFPLYLSSSTLFVIPLALAGLLLLPAGEVDPDLYVLALPMHAGSATVALIVFIGGLSAATGW
jgi:hypothetical protein